jgi:fatty acid desaturase
MAFRSWLILFEAIGLTIFIFGLLVWGYVVIIQVTHPAWLPMAFSHHAFPPLDWRVDDTGMVGFAVAPVGFLMWYLSRTYLTTFGSRKQ